MTVLLAGLTPPIHLPARIGIRVFKAERQMEIWGSAGRGTYRLLATYPIAAMSGVLGPKRAEGDDQVPEGFYTIDRFNPHSRYHLSLGLSYPNASDRRLGSPGHLGKDIFIHGSNVSAGCIAMTDPVIETIYKWAIDAHTTGERAIPVDIYPCRMGDGQWAQLRREFANRPDLLSFWASIRPGYLSFEHGRVWPRPHVGRNGSYQWPRGGQ